MTSEAETVTAHVADMIPLIRATVEAGGTAEMTVTGNSMKPLLLDRESSVRLVKADGLKKGDIVLFMSGDEHYVLHRIMRVGDGVYDIIGDNRRTAEVNIPEANIIAKVKEYNRTGKRWVSGDALYRTALPGIKLARRCYGKARRMAKRLITK